MSTLLPHSGVEDDGYPRGLCKADLEASLATLATMAAEVHAAAQPLRSFPGSDGRQCATARVRRICRHEVTYADLRIAGGALSAVILPGPWFPW